MMNEAVNRMLQRYETNSQKEIERAIREILQEITLVGLWRGKFFEHAAFYGGTALRILYGLDRFSEDLDFTLLNAGSSFDWSKFEKSVTQELSSYGFDVTFVEKQKQVNTPIKSAFLKTNTQNAFMQIGVHGISVGRQHRDAVIRVKVEIDTSPIEGFDTEVKFLKEPLPVSIRVVKEPSLFAGKVDAALHRVWKRRVKGRDWYDLIWFLRRNIPLNIRYLEEIMRARGNLDENKFLTAGEVQKLLTERLHSIEFDSITEDVRPFLRDSSQIDVWSIEFFRYWINGLTVV